MFVYVKRNQPKEYYQDLISMHIHCRITLSDKQIKEVLERRNKAK